MQPTTRTSTEPADQAKLLGLTMTQIFRTPLAALRASMESLAAEFRREDPRGQALQGALDQVSRMTRDVQTLVDLTAPRPVQPLHCSVEEIVESALRARTHAQRQRIQVARQEDLEPIVVDGPLLSNCLAHVLESALESSQGTVLLQARAEGDRTLFAVVREDALGPDQDEDGSPKSASLGLGLALARRDIDRMQGAIQFERSPRGSACVRISVPNRPRAERATRPGAVESASAPVSERPAKGEQNPPGKRRHSPR